jgi:hypothetical protein
MPADLQNRYADLLEAMVREPFHAGGVWLVRPDGYVALCEERPLDHGHCISSPHRYQR